MDVDGTLYYQVPLQIIMIFLLIFSNLFYPKELWKILNIIFYYRKSQEILRKCPQPKQDNYKVQLLLTSEKTGESIAYISRVVEEWFQKRPLPFIYLFRRRGLCNAIVLWQRKGIKLGVYSDYPAKSKLDALGILHLIGTTISASDSEVYGFKPKTNGFSIAAKTMGLDISEILYIGDRPDVDGVGASNAGMQVVILKSILSKPIDDFPAYYSFHKLLKELHLCESA